MPSAQPPTGQEIRKRLTLVFAKGVLAGGAVVVGGWWLGTLLGAHPVRHASWLAIAGAVLLTDGLYYCTHRFLEHGDSRNRVARWFRHAHVEHHRVEELDFFRGNHSSFWDTAVIGFQLPLAVLVTIFGLDLPATLAAYGLVLMLQGTHHVNHTFRIGVLRWVFVDNHAHKLHHCPRGRLVNHAALFSIWDRIGGTYYEDWSMSSDHLQRDRVALPIRQTPSSVLDAG